MNKKFILLILVLLLSHILFSNDKVYIIKMATVAPENSVWMKEMRKFEKEIGQLTNGRLKFIIYPNGIMGSEKDMLRKMRLGQIHSATFTGVGLGEIVPEIRILEVPFFFKSKEEIDYIYNVIFEELAPKFIEKGFFLSGLAEVGYVYLFTNYPIRKIGDFKKVKMWLWRGDPLAKAAFDELGIPAVPLEITDVYTSLQTGLIDGVYISPYGALALQWFTKTKYMLNYPLTNSLGAVLITQKKLNELPEDLREILINKTKEYLKQMIIESRKDNKESIEILNQNGIKIVNIEDPETIAELDEIGARIRRKLIGKLYSQELLDKVEKLLNEFRNEHSEKN
ncbi:MAG: TRAP transporter substrate-binding protein DctP [Candidatus Marinimicrobia bacterium]|nr:TRAP transporter substrate-binding protein DctP [Candidatus Neomarinimicrobiota bacterium]